MTDKFDLEAHKRTIAESFDEMDLDEYQVPTHKELLTIRQPHLAKVKGQRLDEVRARKAAMTKIPVKTQAELQRDAIAINEGHDDQVDPQILDAARMSPGQYAKKYGKRAGRHQGDLNRQMRETEQDRLRTRTDGQTAGDAALGITAGAIAGLGGAASLAAAVTPGISHTRTSDVIGDATEFVTDKLREKQSSNLQRKRELGGIRRELDQNAADAQLEEDLRQGKSFAKLRRFGREALSGAKDLYENPSLAGDLTAEGAGSLVSSFGISKVVTKASQLALMKARGVSPDRAKRFLRSAKGQDYVRRQMERNTPISIGLLEGGSALVEVRNEIQAMDFEDLADAPEFQALLDQGYTKEEARNKLAEKAGLMAAAMQGTAGAVTGKLVAKFEANPLGASGKGLKSALKETGENTIKEATEEAIQGATGALAGDIAIAETADPDRDVFRGAGVDVVSGAVAGGALGAGTGVPRIILGAGQSTVAGAGRAIDGRLDAQDAAADAVSPVGSGPTGEAAAKLAEIGRTVEEAVAPVTEAAAANAETDTDTETAPTSREAQLVNVNEVFVASREELVNVPESVKTILSDEDGGYVIPEDFPGAARIQILAGALDRITDPKWDTDTVKDAAVWLSSQAAMFEALMDADPESMPAEIRAEIEAAAPIINQILSNPRVIQARYHAQTVAPVEDIVVTKENINSEAVARGLERQAEVARVNPANVDAKFINDVLEHSVDLEKSPQRAKLLKNLEVAAKLAEQINGDTEVREAIGIPAEKNKPSKKVRITKSGAHSPALKTQEDVHQEIIKGGRLNTRGQHGLSAHMAMITNKYNAGDIQGAKKAIVNLRNFALTMQNKVAAANQSLALALPNNNAVAYDYWDGISWNQANLEGTSKIGISPFSTKSLQLGQAVVRDAELAANAYDLIMEFYGNDLADGSVLKAGNLKRVTADPLLGATAPVAARKSTQEDRERARAARDAAIGTAKAEVTSVTETRSEETNADEGTDRSAVSVSEETQTTDTKAEKTEETQKTDSQPASEKESESTEEGKTNESAEESNREESDQAGEAQSDTTGTSEDAQDASESESDQETGTSAPAPRPQADYDRMSAKKLIESTNEWDPELQLKQNTIVSEQVRKIIDPVLKTLKLPMDTVRLVGSLQTPDSEHLGQAWWNERTMGVTLEATQALMKADEMLANGEELPADVREAAKTAEHMIMHELGHLIDSLAAGEQLVETRETKSMRQMELMFTVEYGDGAMLSEVLESRKLPEWKAFWSYAMSHSEPEIQASEIFAELTALYLSRIDEARELFPQGVAYVERIIREAGGKPADVTARDTTRAEQETPEGVAVSDGEQSEGDVSDEGPSEAEADNQVEDGAAALSNTNTVNSVSSEPDPELFAGLISDKAIESYDNSFDFTDVMRHAEPLKAAVEKLTEEDREINPERRKVLKGLIEVGLTGLVDDLNNSLQSAEGSDFKLNGEKVSPVTAALSEKAEIFLRQPSGKALNLLHADGKLDPRMTQAAVMAVMDWVLHQGPENNRDRSKIEKQITDTYGVPADLITEDMINHFRAGPAQNVAKEDVGLAILKFWGFQPKPDAPRSDSLGIAEALGAMILEGMINSGLVDMTVGKWKINNPEYSETKPQVVNMHLITAANDNMVKLRDALGKDTDFFATAFGVETEETVYANGAFPPYPTAQRSTGQRPQIGEDRLQAMVAQQETVFERNDGFLGMLLGLGHDIYRELEGYTDIPENVRDRYNILDLSSKEGKNNSIDYNWQNVLRVDEATENDEDIPRTLQFGLKEGSNQRMMMKGFNPQSSKLLRQAYTSTKSVLNLNNTPERDLFWLTIAQGTDEIKVEKKTRKKNVRDVQKLFRNHFKGSRAELAAWLAEGTDKPMSASAQAIVSQELKAAIKNGHVGDGNIPLLMNSLLAVAKFDRAKAAGRKAMSEFEHTVSLEADGKTDGPFNAIMHFDVGDTLAGQFTESMIARMEMGGLFLGKVGQTLNDYLNTGSPDLYERGGQVMANKMAEMVTTVKNNLPERQFQGVPSAAVLMNDLIAVMGVFGDAEIIGDDIVFGRKLMKNPLTISVYGSTPAGIAGKLTDAIGNTLHASLSELIQFRADNNMPNATFEDMPGKEREAKLHESLMRLTKFKTFYAKDKTTDQKVFFTSSKVGRSDRKSQGLDIYRNPQFATLSGDERTQLKENISQLIMPAMEQAIDSQMGAAKDTLGMVQTATVVQSEFLKRRFSKVVQDKLVALRAENKLGPQDSLTPAELREIFTELTAFGAVIEPADSNENFIDVSQGKASTPGHSPEYSRTPQGTWHSNPTGPSPKGAGVAVIPMLTISRGDAEMMVRYFLTEGASNQVLQVYDGLELPAAEIDRLSEVINHAVADTILKNPMEDVVSSFRSWVNQGKFGPALDENGKPFVETRKGVDPSVTEKSFQDTIKRAFKETVWEEQMFEALDDNSLWQPLFLEMLSDLEHASMVISARKAAIARMPFSLDHMAGAESPYTNEGEPFTGSVVDRMNKLFQEEFARIRAESASERAQADQDLGVELENDAALVDQIGRLAAVDENGVRTLTLKQLRQGMMRMREGIPEETKQILKGLFDALESQGGNTSWTISFGPAASLNAMATAKRGTDTNVSLGLTDTTNQVIYISNINFETLTHELFHGALANTLGAYVTDPKSLPEHQRKAVSNIEKLMGQIDDMNTDGQPKSVKTAFAQMRRAMDGHTSTYGKLQEFIAWAMSNQTLIKELKRTKTRRSLYGFAKEVLKQVANLFRWDIKRRDVSVFNSLKVNTGVALLEGDIDSGVTPRVPNLLRHDVAGGSDARLQGLMESFDAKLNAHLDTYEVPLEGETERARVEVLGIDLVNEWTQTDGFDWSDYEQSAFRKIVAALSTSMATDPKSTVQLSRIFDRILADITVEHLMEDPESNANPHDRVQAQKKFDLLVGKFGEIEGTDLMTGFIAAAMVDGDLRKVLEGMDMPKDVAVDGTSVDTWLSTVAESSMNKLATFLSQGRHTSNVKHSLDGLVTAIAKIEADDRTLVEKTAYGIMNNVDGAAKGFLSKVGERLTHFSDREIQDEIQGNRAVVQAGIQATASQIAGLLEGGAKGEAAAESLLSMSNQSELAPTTLKEMIAEVIGITDANRAVYDMVNRVKTAVSAVRQEFREQIPLLFEKAFSRELSKEQWQQMFHAVAKTDVASLITKFSVDQIRDLMINNTSLSNEISRLEETLVAPNPTIKSKYLAKAKELAHFMVTGEVTTDEMLTNAYAIAHLYGQDEAADVAVTDTLIETLDHLTTLYAMRETDPEVRQSVAELAENESEGFDFITFYLGHTRNKETQKQGIMSQVNGWKGYIPSESRPGSSLIVAEDSQMAALESMGYTRVGDYAGSGLELGSRGYYKSNVAGRATFQQGIMQTVQHSAFGVDPKTGRTMSGITAGTLSGSATIRAAKAIERGHGTRALGERLIPRFDQDGKLLTFERSIRPDMLATVERNEHLGEMTGAWAGRQAEEELASNFNYQLVDRAKAMWDNRKTDRRDYVDISTSTDPVHMDAWRIVPAEIKSYIESQFGEAGFPVRKDMVNNVMGYREPSITDPWTQMSRIDPNYTNAFQAAATAIMGKNAFKYLKIAEKGIQTGVSVAKNTIVIRSIVVPLSNLGSNFVQLAVNGVSAREMMKGFPTKAVEITQYLEHRDKIVELDARIAASTKDNEKLKLEARKRSLEAANKRMSIWPLIEAGEFSTISEGLTDADASIGEGKWVDQLSDWADKMPRSLGTAGRYAAITRDTALFKGMSRAVQYGDFLAKAVLYDHEVKQGKTPEQALEKVSEEFVNYNLLPGRVRSYAESMGLTWFWAYKIKSIKIAHRHLRDNPARALLSIFGAPNMPDFFGVSIGSPLTDNMLSVAADGRLGYSVGPGMLFQAPSLHPTAGVLF